MQKIKFYNSGLYNEPSFYKTYIAEAIFVKDYELHVKYNQDLMRTRYSNAELENLDENQIVYLIYDDFFEDIQHHYELYEPEIFNEEVALDCGLIPFTYTGEFLDNRHLLALDRVGFYPSTKYTNLMFKLDAYQLLTHGTIDIQSHIFTHDRGLILEHNKKVLGEEVYNKVMNVIGNEVIW